MDVTGLPCGSIATLPGSLKVIQGTHQFSYPNHCKCRHDSDVKRIDLNSDDPLGRHNLVGSITNQLLWQKTTLRLICPFQTTWGHDFTVHALPSTEIHDFTAPNPRSVHLGREVRSIHRPGHRYPPRSSTFPPPSTGPRSHLPVQHATRPSCEKAAICPRRPADRSPRSCCYLHIHHRDELAQPLKNAPPLAELRSRIIQPAG